MTISTKTPYPTFDHALFGSKDEAQGFENLQWELYKAHAENVHFTRNLSTQRLEIEITGRAVSDGKLLLVKVIYSPRFDKLEVTVYGARQVVNTATFEDPFNYRTYMATVAYIKAVAER